MLSPFTNNLPPFIFILLSLTTSCVRLPATSKVFPPKSSNLVLTLKSPSILTSPVNTVSPYIVNSPIIL